MCEPFATVGREGVAPGGRVAACRSGGPARWEPYHLSRESGENHAGRGCHVVDWPGSAVCRPGRRAIRHGRAGCASTQCPLLPSAVGNTARCAGGWKRWRSRILELRGGDPHSRRSNPMAELRLIGGHLRSGHWRPDIAPACVWFLHGRGISSSGPYSKSISHRSFGFRSATNFIAAMYHLLRFGCRYPPSA